MDAMDDAGAEPLDPALEQLMVEMRAEFIGHAAELISRIDARLPLARRHDPQALAEVACTAHSLKGAGGTFGYPEVTDAAAELERVAREASTGICLAGGVDIAVERLRRVVARLS